MTTCLRDVGRIDSVPLAERAQVIAGVRADRSPAADAHVDVIPFWKNPAVTARHDPELEHHATRVAFFVHARV